MQNQYRVIIEYHSGIRKGQKISIDGVYQDDIISILGEITQDQLANAEIVIQFRNEKILYEDYLIDYLNKSNNIYNRN